MKKSSYGRYLLELVEDEGPYFGTDNRLPTRRGAFF
jgi:hypothetical protein